MSNDGEGYGTDISYVFNPDGSVDLKISDSGDLTVIGGSGADSIEIKRKNAIQHIIMRLITPNTALVDQWGNPLPFGSELYSLIGAKNTELNRLAVRAYVMACLQDYQAIESIVKIDVEFESGAMKITLGVKLKNDSEIIEETVTVG